MARPILHLLHITIPEAYHLSFVQNHIFNAIEPPLFSYMLYNEHNRQDMA